MARYKAGLKSGFDRPKTSTIFFAKIASSSTEPGGFALLGGDASVESGFSEIHVPRTWRDYLATALDFREKNGACFGSIGTRFWRQPPTLPLHYEGKVMKTIFPQNYAYVSKFHRFLFPFSSKFCLICPLYLPVLCHVSHTVSLDYLWI